MWSNYGKTFVEYLYLKRFRNTNSHIEIKGEEILEKIGSIVFSDSAIKTWLA